MSTRVIARRQGVSADAVKYHVANALCKLGLADRAALRAWRGVPRDSALKATSQEGTAMEHDLRLGAIGQISRHVGDLDRAITFYRDVLGLPHLYTFGDLAFFDCAGTRLFLSAAEEGGQVTGESVIYFQVDDIHAACDQLRSRGVEISNAPHLIHRHESGEEEWMAFFPDPDHHLLALMARYGSNHGGGV
jgi:catechol 2,3-dioxygenase-like lactoylglutathione lyase family enzyme